MREPAPAFATAKQIAEIFGVKLDSGFNPRHCFRRGETQDGYVVGQELPVSIHASAFAEAKPRVFEVAMHQQFTEAILRTGLFLHRLSSHSAFWVL